MAPVESYACELNGICQVEALGYKLRLLSSFYVLSRREQHHTVISLEYQICMAVSGPRLQPVRWSAEQSRCNRDHLELIESMVSKL